MSKKPPSSLRLNASVTVDVVILTVAKGQLQLLLIKRANPPFQGIHALPGGFIFSPEPPLQAAHRILQKKTGLNPNHLYLEQLYTFDRDIRDPRGPIISITYFALVPESLVKQFQPSPTTQEPELYSIPSLPQLAFDHDIIIQYAIKRLRNKLVYTNIAYSLLPEQFTLTQLQQLYQNILGQTLDKRNFRKKFLSLTLIEPTNQKLEGGQHRPAQLYKFCTKEPIELDRSF